MKMTNENKLTFEMVLAIFGLTRKSLCFRHRFSEV